ncbi:MAG TPA: DUF4129 domain-containing protein [Arenimonas sp.]|uniref:DUF4129 domain-containing protein n=1 Tax=Arenimonas sp. TaxID=1872635 RepID=UPI002BE78BF4|nr:DUF4129 domain-containing protein [Arenimonas sp.]HMB56287.1 DUF4129 domain-containing protein [Arenimonas sp.]
MRIDSVRIALRPRMPWEAIDLGLSLVRQHAGAIWGPWLLVSLPVLLVLNALAWWIDTPWLALVLMWWLKPVFDRVPLYVLSRAVFGPAPGWRETLRAQANWGWRALWPTLLWRRLDPLRSLHLPIDQLEGLQGARRSQRRGVLRSAVSGPALVLTFMLLLFVLALFASFWMLVLMFVPSELLSDSAKELWETFFASPPTWALLVGNGVLWLAETAVEPFYVGGGFGLYLNRRIHIEAWDLELGFRRLIARLRDATQGLGVAALLMLSLLVCVGLPMPATAAVVPAKIADSKTAAAEKTTSARSYQQVFGAEYRDGSEAFGSAVKKGFQDPLLGENKTVTSWQLKKRWEFKPDKSEREPPAWLKGLGEVFGMIGEYGLWLIVAVIAIFILFNLPRWFPWVRDKFQRQSVDPVSEQRIELPVKLPDDLPAGVRKLWREGQRREALALLYRACVVGLAQRLGAPLPPGTTEAQCLRRARGLNDNDSEQRLRDIVRTWQYAAYAGRWPSDDELDALLGDWPRHFGGAR